MSYSINRFDRTLLAVIEDGTIDRTTELQFIGKNFAGYGEIQNENFLYLLENFAGGNPPSKPLSGQLWYDSGSKKIKVYDNSIWRTLGVTQVSDTAPTNLQEGYAWWDSDKKQWYAYNGTALELIGPEKAGPNTTRMVSALVLDTIGTEHAIIKAVVDDVVMFVISDDEFTLNASNPITGYTIIRKGITLADSQSADGITDPAETWFWGTATNAELLDGLNNTQFLRSDQNTALTGEFTLSTSGTGINWVAGDIYIKGYDAEQKLVLQNRSTDNTIFLAGNTETLKINPSANTLGLTYLGNTIWHSGNHGSGSGLDADTLDGYNHTDFLKVSAKAVDSELLDGIDSTQFLRSDEDDVLNGKLTVNELYINAGEGFEFKNGGARTSLSGTVNNDSRIINLRDGNPATDGALFITADSVSPGDALTELLYIDTAKFEWKGNEIWHAGNDGPGSGLNADTLDGLQAVDFLEVDGKAVAADFADEAALARDSNTVGGVAQTQFYRKTGGAVSGYITLHADPTSDMHAATKQYVDDLVAQSDPLWAGATTFSNVKATYANYPNGTRVSFWEERNYTRPANSNGGSVSISDRYRRTVKKTGANTWTNIGG